MQMLPKIKFLQGPWDVASGGRRCLWQGCRGAHVAEPGLGGKWGHTEADRSRCA